MSYFKYLQTIQNVTHEVTGLLGRVSSEWSPNRDNTSNGVNLEVVHAQCVDVLDRIADCVEGRLEE